MSETRYETVAEERGEPGLAYLRRKHGGAPVELVIVERGRQIVWTLSYGRVQQMVADGAGFLASRPRVE